MNAAGVFKAVDRFAEWTAGVPDGNGAIKRKGLTGAVWTGKSVGKLAGKRFAAYFAGRLEHGLQQVFASQAEVIVGWGEETANAGGAPGRVKKVESRPGEAAQGAGESAEEEREHGEKYNQQRADARTSTPAKKVR